MKPSAAMFGNYFVLFLVVTSVVAQEVPGEPTEVDEGTIATLNTTDLDSLNSTTEERPSKCKEILQGFVDESVNSTRPLIEEHVLNATKSLLADEIIPEVTLQFETEVATAENRLTQNVEELISGLAQKVTALEVSVASKDSEINQLKQRVGGLEQSIASKDTQISQLKQRFRGFEEDIEEIRDGKAFFSAYKNSGSHFSGIVTFDNVDIDTDNQLDKESGVFTCKIPGTYLFTFSGGASTSGVDYVTVYVNYVAKLIIGDKDESNFSNLSYTWTLQLSIDDKVQLKVDYGKMYSDSNDRVYYTGLLIRAD